MNVSVAAHCAGAIVTSFDILDDFKAFSNKSGNAKAVYAPAKGAELSEMHAVAIVGYHGAGTADGYWICLNSWGKDWADGGLFRVSRSVTAVAMRSGKWCLVLSLYRKCRGDIKMLRCCCVQLEVVWRRCTQ